MALALQDQQIRSTLHEDLKASRIAEGKLHLQSYLARGGATLLARMDRSDQLPAGAIGEILSAIGSIELYMPVPSHREAWDGGQNLIVASQVD